MIPAALIKVLLLQFVLVLVIRGSGSPTILYTSTNISTRVSPVGSLAGGTNVYIFGTNFSPDPSLISVFFGSYPCNLLAGSSSTSLIACVTTPATTSKISNLAVTVNIQGLSPLTCSSNNCVFSYSSWSTPIVQELIPRTVMNGDLLNVFGLHRITDPGDSRSAGVGQIQSLLINGYTCSLIDVIQEETINPNVRDYIACRVSSGDEAGEYNFTETVSPGTATSSIRSYQTSALTNTVYQIRLVAEITNDFPHQGGDHGQKLALSMTSESSNPAQYTCEIAGQECIVSSVDSSINVVYVEVPKYNTSNTQYGILNKETNDSSTQMNPYLGSNGFVYSRYSLDLTLTLSSWVDYFRADNISITVLQTPMIHTELGSPEVYGSNYVEFLKGYLHIPNAGVYNFYGLADDQLLVNLALYQNNSNPANMVTIIEVDSYLNDHFNPYVSGISPKYTRNFTSPGYYYMEIVSINTASGGFFKVMMEAPNATSSTPANPSWQIDYISIKQADLKPEIIKVTVKNSGIGSNSYHLFYYTSTSGVLTLQSSSEIKANASASAFLSAINGGLYLLNSLSPQVTLKTYDVNKIVTVNPANAVYYEYSIIINRWRDTKAATTVLPFTQPAYSGSSIIISTAQSHSAPIQGTFKLIINNKNVTVNNNNSISFNIDEGSLSSGFNTVYSSSEIEVSQVMNTYAQDSIEFLIEYFGVPTTYEVKFDFTGLTGGSNNLFDTNFTVIRKYSNLILYDPIPFDFLRTAQNNPQLYLTVNQIPVVCNNCDYIFNQSLTVQATSAQLNGYSIAFTLSNPNSVSFDLSDIEITFLGVPCVVATGNVTNFQCQFANDAKGNSLIPAGTGIPVVHVKEIGYAITTQLTNLTVSISLTSFQPEIAGPQGLVLGTITGSGFPITTANNALKISLCGNLVNNFISLTNTQITFTVPPEGSTCNSASSYISVNSEVFPLNFTYDSTIAPLIAGLSLQSASPILKQSLQITGSNFQTTDSIQVFLYDTLNVQQYELTVVNSTGTIINCILGGGKTGDYYVRVINNGIAGTAISFTSPASFFQYMIFVESISPLSGPMGGGYNITITGRNFAPTTSTNVFIGDASDNICNIASITTTTIVCTLPFMDPSYDAGVPVNVTVAGRAVEQSVCDGTCVFTYDASVSNNVSVLSTTIYSADDVITITGFNLTGAKVFVGGVEAKNVSSTANNVTFTYPALKQGNYNIMVLTSNGYAYPPLPTTTNLWLSNGISRSSGSYAGHIVTVAGNGMTTTINDGNVFTMICPTGGSFKIKRINATASKHAFEVPMNPGTADQYCTVNITQGTVFRAYGYSYSGYLTNVSTAALTSAPNNTFYLKKTNSTSTYFEIAWAEVLDGNGNPTSSVYPLTMTSLNSSFYLLSTNNGYLPAGYLRIRAHSFICGYSTLTGQNVTIQMANVPTGVIKSVSYLGGANLTLTGTGFVDIVPSNNILKICGMKAKVVSSTSSSLVFTVPPLVTQQTQALYGLGVPTTIYGTPFGDNLANINLAVDNNTNTFYSSTSNSTCYVGVDFGINTAANISSISYMGNPNWVITSSKLTGAIFEGSNDQTNWATIFTIDSSVHMGWNYWPNSNPSSNYRYIRFTHNSTSQCQIAEIAFTGQIYSTLPVNATGQTTCNVQLILPNQTLTLPTAQVTYSAALTSTIASITPIFGPSIGGTVLTISGSNFGQSINIVIDGITCSIVSNNASIILCTTGIRANPPSGGNSFTMVSDGNPVILACDPFLYIDRWSAQATWGGQALPRQGDSVYVPAGMTLLVDVSTPILYSVIVDGGSIIFSDEKDMTFDASYFLLNGGQFRAGTVTSPYKHKLTFTLYGGYYDKQLPTFGNKMIGCKNCKFNMHGTPRYPTWTDLNATILPGQTTLQLCEPVDWNVGQSIAVASSSFNHFESQERIISSKSNDNKTLTVSAPFTFKHFAGIESYGGKDFYMRAEVGLLTRNIVMQGDQTSNTTRYGSHLMFNGKVATGLNATLSYSEFRNCGQPKIVGRYCTHFHMAGEVPNSFVRGISVHNSFARVLTIHGTHYLLVEKNVGYRVEGHNIFIEDGIQTKNIIQDNLMISSITSFTMLQSDITVASYWITNPFNTVVRNRAAGGDFYGFWYEIKSNPDGPSATYDVCPMGMQLGLSRDNIAHSNIRFGLRIFKLSARKFPCLPPQDENLIDPYSANPAIESVFTNYTLWKNRQCGFLGEELGFTTIDNFKTIDSVKGGMQFHKTNYTKQLVVATNSVIVGYSQGNGPVDIDIDYQNARGLIAARTDGLLVQNIQFFNFGATMTPLQSCSQCYSFKLWVTGGKTTFFKNITYTNILGNYIFWQKWRREIFMDLDGSLTAPIAKSLSLPNQTGGSVTPQRASLLVPNHCHNITSLWDNSVYCDDTQTLRGILFTNAVPTLDLSAIDIRVRLLSDPYENFKNETLTNSNYSLEPMIVIKKMSMDIPHSWAMPFATGNYYNIHWKWGVDFTHLSIAPSRLWSETDGVVLRFNYSDYRELYEIGKWYERQLQFPYVNSSDLLIDPSNCENGDYYHDQNSSYLFVCVSGRNKTVRQWIDVNGIRCLNSCPKDLVGVGRQNFTRYWSDVNNWANNTLPKAGQNVTIPDTWNLILDCQTPIFNYLQVRGYLIFDQSQDITLQAHYIWVKGKIKIGTKSTPYKYNANIILHGEKDSVYMVIDADASGNKMMVVTGGLEFYGAVTDNVWNRLTAIAPVGSTSITVQDTTGWRVGNKLVIAASYAGTDECQSVTITSIVGNTISFTPALAYEHYGDTQITMNNSVNALDARSGVGLLSRNIRITKGPDANGWGCRVLIYSYYEMPDVISATSLPSIQTGYAILDGVQFDNCGQYDTSYAGLKIQKIGSLKNTTQITSITRSSVHNCVGICVYIDTSNNITFDNNVFYWGRKYLVIVFVVDHYNFTNNLLTEAHNRPELNLAGTLVVDDVSCYEQFTQIDHASAKISVTSNLAQGCMGQGFVFPFSPCDYLPIYRFAGNTAGSCEVAFMIDRLKDQQCLGATGLTGYASQIGLMANPPGSQTELIYKKMFFTDCGRGITLRYAHQTDDNTLYLEDSYFAGYSRPNCPSCYSAKTINYCHGGYAVRMLSVTLTGQTFPLVKKNTVFDVICTQQAFDFKSFLNNVVFENYRYNNPSLPFCSGMSVFKRHNLASDGTGSAHLTNTTCINCDKQSWAYFDQPNPAWLGWFGGCGAIQCTGPNNYFIHDQDGKFTGSPSQLLANNSQIGDNENSCSFVPEINGYHCLFEEFAVMEYESIAPDFNTRIMWPVYLKYDGGNWTSTTNGWREWVWNGPEPMNQRLGRFWSVVRLHKHYNLTYSSSPPTDTRYQLQKRSMPDGNPNDWVIVRIYYPLPNSLQVLVTDNTGTDRIIKPYPSVENSWEDLSKHTSICGANNFYFNNGTIEFVLNGVNNCQIRVKLSDYIQVTAKLSVSVANFYTNNGPTTFLTNICAFLGIDTGRLKIVSVRSGSADVTVFITPAIVSSSSSQNGSAADPSSSSTALNSMATSITNGLGDSSLDLGFPVINYDVNVVVFNTDGTVYIPRQSNSDQNSLIILATVIPISIVIIAVVAFICIRRIRSKIYTHEILGMQSSQMDITEKKEEHHDIHHQKYELQVMEMQ